MKLANALVLLGLGLLAAAGFVISRPLGLSVLGFECVLAGVALAARRGTHDR